MNEYFGHREEISWLGGNFLRRLVTLAGELYDSGMPRVYRSMTVVDSKPMIGRTARSLGIRPNEDIPVQEDGAVFSETGGMSVAPAWRDLPGHRIPKRLRAEGADDASGSNADACWTMGDGDFTDAPFTASLVLRVDRYEDFRPVHGTVQPTIKMMLEEYESALAATQGQWYIDED